MLIFLLIQFVSKAKTILLSDYLDKYHDTSLAIYKALEACRKEKATRLVFPKSTYHCYPERALQKYVSISNNENGIKRIALPVIEQENLDC